MYFKIILKVTKKQGFTLSLEDAFFEKPYCGVPAVLGLKSEILTKFITFKNHLIALPKTQYIL